MITPEVREMLANPAISLQQFGWVLGFEDCEVRYDPYAVTDHLQATIVSYVSDPPRNDEGYTNWLVLLGPRQTGKSSCGALSFYSKAQYTPGWEHITAADHQDRADYLFERVAFCHQRWPEDLKEDQYTSTQRRALQWTNGSKMQVLSGRTAGAGVGRGTSSFHGSEIPLWQDAETQFSYLLPAMRNRVNSMMLVESTPFALDEPSAPYFRDLCNLASRGEGRWLYAFFPFWDGKLNARRWRPEWRLENEEIRLLERFGHLGLRKKHLAFRRMTMAEDPKIAKQPELFQVYYPFDDLTCWLGSSRAVIRQHHLARHMHNLIPWREDQEYREYLEPKDGALYVIGVDPSGYGTRDHASFHVFEIWAGRWEQAAVYSGWDDPPAVVERLCKVGRRYNNAVICPERNGVGTAVTTGLQLKGYPNLWLDKNLRPGMHKTNEAQLLSKLIEGLQGPFIIHDKDTIAQLQTYQSDKSIQETERQVLLRSNAKGRRPRHHWDKVSALQQVASCALTVPQRNYPGSPHEPRLRLVTPDYDPESPIVVRTMRDLDRLAAAQARARRARSRGVRRRYTGKRRRR